MFVCVCVCLWKADYQELRKCPSGHSCQWNHLCSGPWWWRPETSIAKGLWLTAILAQQILTHGTIASGTWVTHTHTQFKTYHQPLNHHASITGQLLSYCDVSSQSLRVILCICHCYSSLCVQIQFCVMNVLYNRPTSLNSWIWDCSNMLNTLELPSVAFFLALFGALGRRQGEMVFKNDVLYLYTSRKKTVCI